MLNKLRRIFSHSTVTPTWVIMVLSFGAGWSFAVEITHQYRKWAYERAMDHCIEVNVNPCPVDDHTNVFFNYAAEYGPPITDPRNTT